MNFNEFLSLAVAAIILGIVGYVTSQLIPAVKDWLKLHLSEKDRDLLNAIFNEIIQAVEYARLKAAAEGAAFDALKYGLMLADLYLQRYGIDLDEALIEAMLRKWLSNHIEFETDPPFGGIDGTAQTVQPAKTPKDRYWA
jgi:hypothetical protein